MMERKCTMSSHRGRGNRGGAFPARGRATKYVSKTRAEAKIAFNVNVVVSSETQAIEIQRGNVNQNRGRGSRGRSNFRPPGGFHPHAESNRAFSKPEEKSIVGKTTSPHRGRQRAGKGNPHQGHPRQTHNAPKSGHGSGSQKSSAKKMDNMKRSVSCGICLEIWTRPKTLPCDHVFCEKCLEKVIRGRQVVTCPECRQEHKIPSQGIRNSWFTHRYLESLADDFKELKT